MFITLPFVLVILQMCLVVLGLFGPQQERAALAGSAALAMGCFVLTGFIVQDVWSLSANALLYLIVGSVHVFYGVFSAWFGAGLWRVAVVLQPMLAALLGLAWVLPVATLKGEGLLLTNSHLQWHIASATVAYAILTLAAFFAFAVLLRQAYLKAQKRGVLVDRLPALDVLEKAQGAALWVSFAALLFAALQGALYTKGAHGVWLLFEVKTVLTLTSLLLVAGLVLVRSVYGFAGRVGARVVVLVYGLIVASFLLVFF